MRPKWADKFADKVFSTFNEAEGSIEGFEYQYSGKGEQQWDDHLLVFLPSLGELSGGANDGSLVFSPMSVFAAIDGAACDLPAFVVAPMPC